MRPVLFARRLMPLLVVFVLVVALSRVAQADEGWVIRSFDASYQVNADGSIDIIEDIRVDFGALEKHGIFRDLIVEQRYDSENVRRYRITVRSVDDGESRHRYETSISGAALRLKIGDPNREISGEQRYRITYRLEGALNAQPEWDELYWNVTGHDWPVTMEHVSVNVSAPSIERVDCFEGARGSTTRCDSRIPAPGSATFDSTRILSESHGLTIVVAIPTGQVAVAPPDLVHIKTGAEQVRDFVGLTPAPLILAGILAIGSVGLVGRYWWLAGRDRWFGDVHYLTAATEETRRPLFARDTVVVEYGPPEIEPGRPMRPAEAGTLLDERADTVDVSATIVDLAVRGYLRISEVPKKWIFGDEDYHLERLKPSDEGLLGYERLLLEGLFEDGDEVTMSGLKNEFYDELAQVKKALYEQTVKADRFFAGNPESIRMLHRVGGLVVVGAGVFAIVALGSAAGLGIIGGPVVLAGLALLALSRSMPRRTARGREMFRRTLGFRTYMTVAETERQRFAEEENIFEKYLPFAMVFDCVDKWAEAFEGLESQPAARTSGWYVSSRPFAPLAFSQSINSFSSSMSSAITSTPGGSGDSGFSSSGGSSGGGGGGGGGGSW